MEPERERIVSVDQLPDDPMEMPPPYWRSSGAIFCLLDAVRSVSDLLPELVCTLERTELELQAHYEKYPENEQTGEEMEEFLAITHDLMELENRIKAKTMVAILMSAIEVEDRINQFCVFNMHKDVAESIEKLPPPERLLTAAGMVGKGIGKGHAVYGDIKTLMRWRNAFAHGHCVDRPTKSLRHNHLISPDEYPGIISRLSELQRLVSGYLRVAAYMVSISRNSYTSMSLVEEQTIGEMLTDIARYRFVGNEHIYSITVSDPAD